MVFVHNVTPFLRCLDVTGIFVHVKRRSYYLSMKFRKVLKEGNTMNADAIFSWKLDSKLGVRLVEESEKTMLTVLGTIWKLHIRNRNLFQKTI